MKTPRELLLGRHPAMTPKLERMHETALSAGREKAPGAAAHALVAAPMGFFVRFWQEVFVPSRGTWGTLAAVWVILAVIHFSDKRAGGFGGLKVGVPSEATLAAFQRQQLQLLAGVLPRPAQAPAASAPPAVPLPEGRKTSGWVRREVAVAV